MNSSTLDHQLSQPLQLSVRGLTRSYGPIKALQDVSLEVRAGEVHALCGHNGAGKSTMLKILAGSVQPDSGVIELNGSLQNFRSPRDAQASGIALVDQELSIVPQLTVEDNVLLGRLDLPFLRSIGTKDGRVRQVLDTVGLHQIGPKQFAEDLTIGERQLLQIARALGRNAQVLILDEPTATLTAKEANRVFKAVKNVVAEGRSVIFVSHRLDEVLDLCDRVTVLRDGKKVATRDVAGLTSGELVHLILGDVEAASRATRSAKREGGLRVKSLSVGDRVVDVSFDVAPGEIVSFAGQMGSGGVEILRALGGLRSDVDGMVELEGKGVRLGSVPRSLRQGLVYVSHDRKGEGLFLGHSTLENLVATRLSRLSRAGIVLKSRVKAIAVKLAESVGVSAGRLSAQVGALSGGNQQKVLIGRCLEQAQTRVLLLDEPTRGVDVGGREDIHRLIFEAADKGVAVLVASAELDEVLDLADRIVTMRAGRQVAIHDRQDTSLPALLREMTFGEDDE
jgi:ABC-type sugar transport system ATPase subunit